MSTVALSGNDSLVINNRPFADFADGDALKLTFQNDVGQVKTGKNGNALFALNETGRQGELEIRLIRGSSDDKFMNGLQQQQDSNFAGFPLLQGEYVKQVGVGGGVVIGDTYLLGSGIFFREVDAKMNVEGDVDQSVSVYRMKFAKVLRAIT